MQIIGPATRLADPGARLYNLDWIKALAIYLVLFVHCIGVASDCHKHESSPLNDRLNEKKDGVLRALIQIGIPCFFYISGSSVALFKTERKSFMVYLLSKLKRLVLPFIVTLLFVLIPTHYLMQGIAPESTLREEPITNFFEYFGEIFPQITFKLNWLWFLLALFIDSISNYPLLMFTQRRKASFPISR